jgi:hypothetical protein
VDEVQQIVSKEKFSVKWGEPIENFRDTNFMEPTDMINVLTNFTDFETGFRNLLVSTNHQVGLIDL